MKNEKWEMRMRMKMRMILKMRMRNENENEKWEMIIKLQINKKFFFLQSFNIGQYCWLKKSLKLLAFSEKLVTNFPLTNNGEIKDSFSPLTKSLLW